MSFARFALTRRDRGVARHLSSSLPQCLSWRRVAYMLTCFYIACLVVAFYSVSTLHSYDLSSSTSGLPNFINLEMILEEFAGAPPIIVSTTTSSSSGTTTSSKTIMASPPLAPKKENVVLAQTHAKVVAKSDNDSRIDDWYESILAKMENSITNVTSCRRVVVKNTPNSITLDNNADFYYSLDPLAACRALAATTNQKQRKIMYYNPHSRPRLLCGHEVPANGGILELDQPCLEPSRLFPVIPSLDTANQLPPTTLRFNDKLQTSRVQPFPDCNVPCYSGGSIGVVGIRTVDGTPFKFHFSMEGPQYYPELYIKEFAYKQNNFYSTTSFQSEIPLPYFSYAEYDIQNPAVDYNHAEKAAVFLARNCGSRSNREDLVKALQESSHFRIDSLSQCLHNAELPPGLTSLGNKITVMQHYLFYLAFENQREDDYVTEKFWGPYVAGTVPVYFGAPNIKQLAPNRSYIDVDDFATPDDLARYLNQVASNQTLYESYHTWRNEPLPPHFTAKFNISKTHSTCRTCRWAFARMYGLGWSHENQTIAQELQSTARNVCLNNTINNKNLAGSAGIITRPFREVWLDALTNQQVIPFHDGDTTDAASSTLLSSCQEVNSQTRVIHLDHGRLKRTVWEQDGVVDIVLEYQTVPQYNKTSAHQLQLRLETPLEEPAQLSYIQEGQIRLQNNHSRFTLLSWPTRVVKIIQHVTTLNGRSVLVLNLHHDPMVSTSFPLRLRIIVEDVDLFHNGAYKLENYFGHLMKEDFFQPVEAFLSI